MQQRQQETMKLPLYSETKGRKKLSAVKKRDQIAQIKAPSTDRVVVLDENGVPLGHRQCSVCKKVAGHNKLTCPTLLKRNNAEEVKQPKVQKQHPKVIEQNKGPHPQKASSRHCSICKEYAPHNARTCPKRADAEKTSQNPEKKQREKP